MNRPIVDFVNDYIEADTLRLHMPGHKGHEYLGFEAYDITEFTGADNLYNPTGIIKESEDNATKVFETKRTFYSTEGSSQCIKTMLYLAVTNRKDKSLRPLILAGRNAHTAFLHAAALIDFDVEWLTPEKQAEGCACPITPEGLKAKIASLNRTPDAVYVTSPDYLGGVLDIEGLARVSHECGTLLIVDNAHGAYFKFLPERYPEYKHPIEAGADMCCDSAHKTLPGLTGSAYIHFGQGICNEMVEEEKDAQLMFGSSSPSYLILQSLDNLNPYLLNKAKKDFNKATKECDKVKKLLESLGFKLYKSDPMKITIKAPEGESGFSLGSYLREAGAECEYEDEEFIVLMPGVTNVHKLERLIKKAFKTMKPEYKAETKEEYLLPARKMTIREAMLSKTKTLPANDSLGKICASSEISCPPCIPVIMPGEVIDEETIKNFNKYKIASVRVVAD